MTEGLGLKVGDHVMMKRDQHFIRKQMKGHDLELDWDLNVAAGKKVQVECIYLGSKTVSITCDNDEDSDPKMDVIVPRNCLNGPLGKASQKAPARVNVKKAAKAPLAKVKATIGKKRHGDPMNGFKAQTLREMKKNDVKEMTRTVYKNKLVKAGFPVQADQDVLHIIAKANGGADHPNNYHFVGNASLNRSLGNRNDHVMAFMAGKKATAKAVAISKELCSYNGPGAAQLYRDGEAEHRGLRRAIRAKTR